ncbi:MAG TPA: 50S ribosomal protein L4, partial [Candidatus Competibacteraceae bacterium]|nr:50S ribosomal protein L4 [Candidatus Competibacteraceae bacterium]
AIFSELQRQDRLLVIDNLTVAEPRTKLMKSLLAQLGIVDNVLLVSEALDEKVDLAARNLPQVGVCDVGSLDPVGLIRFDKVVITAGAVARVGEWLA